MNNKPIVRPTIRNLIEGQYHRPVRIVALNTADGWSRDVTAEIEPAPIVVGRLRRSLDQFASRSIGGHAGAVEPQHDECNADHRGRAA